MSLQPPSSSIETFLFQDTISELIKQLKNNSKLNKSLFLKELISNASDALDKIRYASLSDPSVLLNEKELFIKIVPDLESKSLSIIDSGVGMSKSDLILNLGSTRRGGTRQFVELLKQGDDICHTVRYFIGFHSAFMVAEKVVVSSKTNGEESHVWESTGNERFNIITDNSIVDQLRGTTVTLYLKDDYLEFLDQTALKSFLNGYVRSINYPISLQIQKNCEVLNKDKLLWDRNPNTISKIEYSQFYKILSNEWDDYLAVSHFVVEGILDYKVLVFIPKIAHYSLTPVSHLYVRRMFITDNCTDLLPEYLQFLRVVVDSEDLPLNISPSSLSENKVIKVIRRQVTRRCVEMIGRLVGNNEDFKSFYQCFGRNIKMGIIEDTSNRASLVGLLRFHSNFTHGNEWKSLREYCSHIREGQEVIYFSVCAENKMNSTLIDDYSKKGFEVLLLWDVIDSYVIQKLEEFDGKKFYEISE